MGVLSVTNVCGYLLVPQLVSIQMVFAVIVMRCMMQVVHTPVMAYQIPCTGCTSTAYRILSNGATEHVDP